MVNNKLQKKTVPELGKLRQELVKSYSIARTQIEHSKLLYDNLVQDTQDLTKSLSDDTITEKRDQLLASYKVSKKRIEELSVKKKEIREINRIIDSFHGVQELSYSEEEMMLVFGDQAETIKKNAPGIMKRSSLVRVKKEVDEEQRKANLEGEEKEEGLNTPEEFETKEVVRYVFKANLNSSVDKLSEIQSRLKQSISQYEKEIDQIKKSYIEDVKKFEAIKKIVGIDSGNEHGANHANENENENENGNENDDEDGDVEMGEGDSPAGETDRDGDDREHEHEHQDRDVESDRDEEEDGEYS